jgi:hypothetical protein
MWLAEGWVACLVYLFNLTLAVLQFKYYRRCYFCFLVLLINTYAEKSSWERIVRWEIYFCFWNSIIMSAHMVLKFQVVFLSHQIFSDYGRLLLPLLPLLRLKYCSKYKHSPYSLLTYKRFVLFCNLALLDIFVPLFFDELKEKHDGSYFGIIIEVIVSHRLLLPTVIKNLKCCIVFLSWVASFNWASGYSRASGLTRYTQVCFCSFSANSWQC